jgi:quinol monooxygenase YgiN
LRLTEKAGKADELEAFLRKALRLVEDERETVAWFAVAIGGSLYAIVDAFPHEQGRQSHLDDPVAAALFGEAAELLEAQPEIEYVDVLAANVRIPRGHTSVRATGIASASRVVPPKLGEGSCHR